MTDRKRTAWILGAGFSRPLGGPTLATLFTQSSLNHVLRTYPGLEGAREMRLAVDFYRKHNGEVENDAGIYWNNPEDFLDKLELSVSPTNYKDFPARNDYPHYRASAAIYCDSITALASARRAPEEPHESAIRPVLNAARRLLAAECSWFLAHAQVRAEPWAPYVDWAMRLEGGTDTVVTFNYDRVLEVLGEYLSEHFGTTRFAVKLPYDNPQDVGGTARVLKLHGSVDWLRGNPKQFTVGDHDCAVKSTNIENLAIATPGASKRSLVDELAPLWDAAHDAITNARRIVIIGYRLPETDAYARTRILSAIRSNIHGADIEVVLGPETHHVDCVRLTQLLEYCKPDNGKVVAVPLFGQDFLDVDANK